MRAGQTAYRSWLLVAGQFALIGLLVVTTRPSGEIPAVALAAMLAAAAAAVGIAALAANRPSNFNIRPELKDTARLVTHGIYAHVRHPMYASVLLAMLACIALDVRVWRIAAWFALAAVLIVKLAREERYLLERFPEYAAYRARTWRLIPGVW